MSIKHKSEAFLRVIAIYKLLGALFFATAGFCALRFIHTNTTAWVMQTATHLRFDITSHYVHESIRFATSMTQTKIEVISTGFFIYAALFATEGIGLYLRKRWAEYLVAILTASFLPIEIYEVAIRVTWWKLCITCGNFAILGYLLYLLFPSPANGATPEALAEPEQS